MAASREAGRAQNAEDHVEPAGVVLGLECVVGGGYLGVVGKEN